jgi:hypothetical protein
MHPDENEKAMPVFRRRFEVPAGVTRAVLHVCGLGHHELVVNGRRVGEALLSPGWTKYDKTCLYETFDITALLEMGRPNMLGVLLGNGMYNVPGGRYAKFTGSFGLPKLIAQVHLFSGDAEVGAVATGDGQWQCCRGPIEFSCTYGGEDHDARRLAADWCSAGSREDGWLVARVCDGPGGVLRGYSHSAPAIVAHERLRPVSSREMFDCCTLYDFGQNLAMMPEVRVSGDAGTTVRITPSELIHADGTLDRRSCAHGAMPSYWQYTLAGDGAVERWMPRFTYHGARYALVECTGAAGVGLPKVESIESVVVHSSAEPVGDFECSVELFNRTRELIRNSQRSNLVSVLTDCPHREKLGWLEQYHLHGPSLRYEFDMGRLFSKTMQDMADSQTADGLVPDIAPEYVVFKDGFRDSPEWGAAAVLVPWQQYQWTGDATLIEGHYEVMRRYLVYLRSKARRQLLWHGLGDWYDLGPKKPGRAQLTPIALTASALYFEVAAVMAKAAALLHKAEDAAVFRAEADAIKAAFHAEFFDDAKGAYGGGSQTAQAIPLVMGLVPERHREAVVEAMCRDVVVSKLTAGDIGHRYLLRALADAGRSDLIYQLHTDTTRPGYGWILNSGATSLTEAWDAGRESSHNHFMLGHITEWFYRDLAGIRPDESEPGFVRFALEPQLIDGVDWVRAQYRSAKGMIGSSWRCDGRGRTFELSVPAGTVASATLPVPEGMRMVESAGVVAGDVEGSGATVEGVKFVGRTKDAVRLELASGRYRFVCGATQ